MDSVALVTIMIFVAGVVYYSGRLSARVESLEDWRRDFKPQLDDIFAAIRRVDTHVTSERV